MINIRRYVGFVIQLCIKIIQLNDGMRIRLEYVCNLKWETCRIRPNKVNCVLLPVKKSVKCHEII